MKETKYMVELKSRSFVELARIELRRAQKKLAYAENLLEEVEKIVELLEELLENENSL
jgi:hypothetical protein